MDLNLNRLRDADLDLDLGTGGASAPAGKSSLTSRLTPAPQLVFRVSDPDTARALGESMGGGRGRIQRVADRDDNGVAAGAEAAVDRAASSSGQALPTHLQRQFEQSTGADLSGVRVHTGGESATAARAVGAKAYTVGQDIHFAEGRYQPDDPFGMHLLAHEVAHTVQQQGGAAHRQHKLEVSTPHDAAEVEADRAADAMVRGEATAIGGGAGVARQVVQRDEAPKPAEEASAGEFADTNKAWAEGIRPDIQDVTDTTAAAKETLSADAEAAIAAITTAQTSYTNYEKKYDSALARFKAGVEAAQKQEEDLRAAAKIVANTALGAYFPLLAATKGAISGVLETVNDAASVAGVVGIVPKPAEKGGASDKGMGPSDKVDWKALLQTTIDAFKSYLSQNKALDAIATDATGHERYLSAVIEGKHDDVDASTTDAGSKAGIMAAEHNSIGISLESIVAGTVSGPADEFAQSASGSLDKLTDKKIEQDIAIKWISGLTREQRDEIDTADSYLKSLGLIDVKNSRLDYDTGDWTMDGDEVMIHLRAQVEQMAMNAIGPGEWMGRDALGGKVRDAHGIVWPASAPAAASDKAGGQVQINKYSFFPTQGIGDASSRPGSENQIKEMMVASCVMTISLNGPTGGGVYEGPEVRPASK
jgi:hypothetical protein